MTINFPTDITKFAVCGDWHANTFYAEEVIDEAAEKGIRVILHVGDFGFLRSIPHYLEYLNNLCQDYNIIIVFVDGNHEDHTTLNKIPVSEDGVRRVASNIWHLPRGFRWEWDGVKFLALGGAHSVDRQSRTMGVDWFSEEVISLQDAYRITAEGPADVMICHDCPAGVNIPGIQKADDSHGFFPPEEIRASEQHRELLRNIVEEISPRYLWCGHYHKYYAEDLTLNNGQNCHVQILNMDNSPISENMNIIETKNLHKK